MAEAKKLDEFAQLAKAQLKASIEERNGLVATLKASQGDKTALVESLRNTVSEDANVEKIRQAREKAYAEFERLTNEINALLDPIADEMLAKGKANVDELTTKVGELDKTIKAGLKYFEDIYGSEVLSDLPERITLRGSGASGSGGGTGNRRVRGFNCWVDGTLATARDAKGVERSNLAAGAKVMGISAEDMRNAFWQAQGTQESKDFKDEVTFTVTVGDKTFNVKAERNTSDES